MSEQILPSQLLLATLDQWFVCLLREWHHLARTCCCVSDVRWAICCDTVRNRPDLGQCAREMVAINLSHERMDSEVDANTAWARSCMSWWHKDVNKCVNALASFSYRLRKPTSCHKNRNIFVACVHGTSSFCRK